MYTVHIWWVAKRAPHRRVLPVCSKGGCVLICALVCVLICVLMRALVCCLCVVMKEDGVCVTQYVKKYILYGVCSQSARVSG